MFMEWI